MSVNMAILNLCIELSVGKLPIVLEEFRIYPTTMKENRRVSTCNRLDLQTLGSHSGVHPAGKLPGLQHENYRSF